MAGTVRVGPWGGDSEGGVWNDPPIGAMLTKITVVFTDEYICSIQFTYVHEGYEEQSVKHGCDDPDGAKNQTVNIADGEMLTRIFGTVGPYGPDNITAVTSLGFVVGNRRYGPYGKHNGTEFSLPVDSGHVFGFFGRSGDALNSLGVILTPSN